MERTKSSETDDEKTSFEQVARGSKPAVAEKRKKNRKKRKSKDGKTTTLTQLSTMVSTASTPPARTPPAKVPSELSEKAPKHSTKQQLPPEEPSERAIRSVVKPLPPVKEKGSSEKDTPQEAPREVPRVMPQEVQEVIQAIANENVATTRSIHLAPICSINEFVLDKTRYQLPKLSDFRAWNDRIVGNLLRYQTNYLLIIVLFALIVGFAHPRDVVVGASAIGLVLGALAFAFSKHEKVVQARANYPYMMFVLLGLAALYFVYALPAVCTALFAFSFPLLISLLHASIRVQDIDARVDAQAGELGLNETIMSRALNSLGVIKNSH